MNIALGIGVFVISFLAGAASKVLIKPNWAKRFNVAWSDSVGTVHADLPYGDGPAQKFDLYLPAAQQDTYGLAVYLHPGGFTAGDKAGDRDMLQWLCSKGYVAAGINYTLFSEEHPEANVLHQTYEIHDSVPHVLAAAAEHGYTIDRMAVGGGSAGGCLALIYAYRDGTTGPVPTKLVFEAVGPASMRREDWTCYGLDKNDEAAAAMFTAMSGTVLSPKVVASGEYLDAVRDISAADLVTADAPVTIMAYGKHDRICPFPSSERLARRLKELGVPHEYFIMEHSGHGLQNDSTQYLRYMEAVERGLAAHLSSPTR